MAQLMLIVASVVDDRRGLCPRGLVLWYGVGSGLRYVGGLEGVSVMGELIG